MLQYLEFLSNTPFPGLFGSVSAYQEIMLHHLGWTRVGLCVALKDKRKEERESEGGFFVFFCFVVIKLNVQSLNESLRRR